MYVGILILPCVLVFILYLLWPYNRIHHGAIGDTFVSGNNWNTRGNRVYRLIDVSICSGVFALISDIMFFFWHCNRFIALISFLTLQPFHWELRYCFLYISQIIPIFHLCRILPYWYYGFKLLRCMLGKESGNFRFALS